MRQSLKKAMLYIGPSSVFASALMRVVNHYLDVPSDIIGDLYLVAYILFNIGLIFVYPHSIDIDLKGEDN